MTTAQAAEALGVRPSTVYAYVSRGVLGRVSEVVEGRRVSFFDRAEVLGLAAERARSRAGVVSTLIESDVTSLDPRGGSSSEVTTSGTWPGRDSSRPRPWSGRTTACHGPRCTPTGDALPSRWRSRGS